ncbi:adenosylcobinamide-phosphate synthase CbiB [Novosphingobium sp. Leaf2]|uniref:adenosylcobinamide-phosphate synthase CbiB n=1 Tax=Novosphingobium sp. Leaf2 TaxID=1735670 RepID=UPI0006F230D6|nr:adenosylcobinamide-phosphate synthase CbiB [Novosphingobium sp. Leaf2]KQM21769.1 adenosylcobinamide-phosphate synthase [Novosphingobium sp. Leaf2]
MLEPVAAAALGIEALLGWPGRVHAIIGHPVGAFAALIGWCEKRLNRQRWSDTARRAAGLMAMIVLMAIIIATAISIEFLVRAIAGAWAWPLLALLAWPAIAVRSLDDHVRPIHAALRRDDLPGARRAVQMIVGRDTAALDEAGVTRAAIESLAESFCDGVVAPLFWLMVLGLPGAWALKAINTADSLIGHREAPYGPYGWAAARLDDLAMLVPARLSAVLLCLAGGGGWHILARDHAAHASPNAGWPEAAMAGALGVRLAGPAAYDGALADKAWIGDGRQTLGAPDLARALTLYRRACVLVGVLAMSAVWLG